MAGPITQRHGSQRTHTPTSHTHTHPGSGPALEHTCSEQLSVITDRMEPVPISSISAELGHILTHSVSLSHPQKKTLSAFSPLSLSLSHIFSPSFSLTAAPLSLSLCVCVCVSHTDTPAQQGAALPG